jgi:hypothetical protein
MTARISLAELSAPEGAESMNRSNAPRGATVGGRPPDEQAAMSLRSNNAGRDIAGRLYAGRATTGVVTVWAQD